MEHTDREWEIGTNGFQHREEKWDTYQVCMIDWYTDFKQRLT